MKPISVEQLREAGGRRGRREQQHDRGRPGRELAGERREVRQRRRRRGHGDRGSDPEARGAQRRAGLRRTRGTELAVVDRERHRRTLRGAEQRAQPRAPRRAHDRGLQRGLRADEPEAEAVAVPPGGRRRTHERDADACASAAVSSVSLTAGTTAKTRRRRRGGVGRVAGVLDGAAGHSPAPVRAREARLRADLGAGRRGIGADEAADGDGRAGDTDRAVVAAASRRPRSARPRRRSAAMRQRARRTATSDAATDGARALLDRDDAAARVRHLHRVRGAVARHERAARRGQRVRGRERGGADGVRRPRR